MGVKLDHIGSGYNGILVKQYLLGFCRIGAVGFAEDDDYTMVEQSVEVAMPFVRG